MSPLIRFLAAAMALLTLVRWGLAATMEVTPSEAYLFQLALHRTWIGCDGGGIGMLAAGWAAWMVKSPLMLRLLMPLVALAASWMLFRLVQKMANDRAGAWTVVILNLLPAFNLGAILLRPEWIAALFVTAGLQLLWTGLHRAGTWNWHWPAAGALWGLALLADLSAFSLPFSFAFLLLASRRWRGRLWRPGPWLLLVSWLVIGILPLAWWNHQHGGALVDHWLLEMGWGDISGFAAQTLLHFVWQMTLALSPLFVVSAMLVGLQVARRQPREDAAYFLFAFSLPGFALLAGSAMIGLGKPTHLIPLIPPLCALLAFVWQPGSNLLDRRSLWQWITMGTAALASLTLLNTDLWRRAGILRSYDGDPSRQWQGWQETAAEASRIIQDSSAEFPQGLMLIAETPQLAAALDFYLPENLPILTPHPDWPRIQVMESPVPTSQYAFWPRYDEESETASQQSPDAEGPTALFFTDVASRTEPPSMIEQSFAEVTPLMEYEVRRHGNLVRRIKIFACRDYRGTPL